jgi:DNA topoisomerase-1
MNDAKIEKQDIVSKTIDTKNIYTFKSNFQKISFDGFLKVLPLDVDNSGTIEIKENDIYGIKEVSSSQHFTEPPARYNDASLVKTLEKYGIGRPSTYATIISTLIDRGYVSYNENKSFAPSDIGTKTCDMLTENFPNIADFQMTANLEEKLDLIAEGKDN